MNGKFISIEGIEGAGKSTQLAFIAEYLRQRGVDLVVTREPGGTEVSEKIRTLLLTPSDEPIVDDAELLLMFAARVQHIQHKILPALARGQWVLSDRFVDATYAYQGGGRGIDSNRIQQLADWSLQGISTDITFLFDLPVETGQQRVKTRGNAKDRIEQEKHSFFDKVRQHYLQLAEAEPNRIKIIDAALTIEAIQAQLSTQLDQLLDTAKA
ncbi:dTMP kinase [Methylophaga sp. OBS3]|uniref:dTMP kinase n=1 Tax=Methylophaga sp. OBS3 TaxID=2991934 RepID=UPI002259604F|nr:dTMP kinase [Methylophaga sp. OBS3]MCX4189255.1 dTMP kinase [Methylophaga sp. OBS3]